MKNIVVLQTKSLKKVLESIPTLKEGEKIEYEDPISGATTIFTLEDFQEKEEEHQVKVSRKLTIQVLGIFLENVKESAVITKLMFFNNSNCYVPELDINLKDSFFGEIKTQIDKDGKVHITKHSKESSTDFDRGILTHLTRISNDEYTGIVTHKKVAKVSLINMGDLIGGKIFSDSDEEE
jgi:hypothetical protein